MNHKHRSDSSRILRENHENAKKIALFETKARSQGFNFEILYKGPFDQCYTHPQGILLEHQYKFILNGKRYLGMHEECDEFRSHPRGVIFRDGDRFRLNHGFFICHADFDEWQPHQLGVVTRKGNCFTLNAMDRIYEGSYDTWFAHPQGIVIVLDGKFLLNGNPEKVLYEGPYDDLDLHPQGFVIRLENDFWLNGTKFLCNSNFEDWFAHELGVMLVYDTEVKVNEEVVYNGEQEAVYPHPEGVIVQFRGRFYLFRLAVYDHMVIVH